MATDDERREVAERLRDVARAEGWPLGDIGFTEAMHRALGGDGWRDMTERLANLIEPSESGQNRDRNQDTVPKESPAVLKVPECDRDALLALADECDMMRDDGLPIGSYEIYRIARRIREAMGVSDD